MTDLPYPDNPGQTHFVGCWRVAGHHNCAVIEIERLKVAYETSEAANLVLEGNNSRLKLELSDWRRKCEEAEERESQLRWQVQAAQNYPGI